jgi:hypothetical protein
MSDLPSDVYKNRLHGIRAFPIGQTGHPTWINLYIQLASSFIHKQLFFPFIAATSLIPYAPLANQ